MSKILITGGAGFLGYHLAVKLSAMKNTEIVLASRTLPRAEDEELSFLLSLPNVKFIQADLTDKSAWSKLGNGYDFVYHFVSIKGFKNFNNIPEEVLRVGIVSTLHALDWFRLENKKSGAKILYTSTNEVYIGGNMIDGNIPNPAPENVPATIPNTYDPRWSHAGQKLIGELFFIHYAKAYNFRMVIVRPTNIYGPRADYNGMILKIIKQAKEHTNPFTIFGPDDRRTFCYVEDAVSALITVMQSDKTDGQTYNIGDNHLVSIKDMTEIIFQTTDWHPKDIILDKSPREAVRNSVPDISKIERDTGWKPQTSLKEGIKKTVKWYTEHPYK